MKKIITFLICIPFFINAQNGISIDTLYSGVNTNIMFYNHSIDFTTSGDFLNPFTTNFALTNINILNTDTATATIFCNPLVYNNNISTPYLYKYDLTNDNYEQLTQFTIIDTLSHQFITKPYFANLGDTITLEGKWNNASFDLITYNTYGNTINALVSDIIYLDNTFAEENAAFMDFYSSDSLFKENVRLESSAQTGFHSFSFTHFNDGPAIHSMEIIEVIDSAIFINPILTGNSTISGSVIAGSGKTSGDLIEKLVIYLIDENENYVYVTETNTQGLFSFENVEIGNYKLVAGDKYNEKFPVESGNDLSLSYKDGKLETFITSITQLENKDITIFPNPTSKYIEIRQINSKNIKSINIINSIGQEVLYINNPTEKINISELEKGIYFINLNNNGKTTIHKFVIN